MGPLKLNKHYSGLIKKNITLQLRQKKSNIAVFSFISTVLFILIILQITPWFSVWFSNAPSPSNNIGTLPNTTDGHSGVLGNITQLPVDDLRPGFYSPFFVQKNSPNDIDNQLDALNTYLETLSGSDNTQNIPNWKNLSDYTFPFGAVNVNQFMNGNLNYTVQVPFNGASYFNAYVTREAPWSSHSDTAHVIINFVTNGFWRSISGNPNVTVLTTAVAFPSWAYNDLNLDLSGLISMFFVPACLIFLLPLQLYTMVSEKHERLIELMKMMGMRTNEYWVSTYIFAYIMYLVVATLVTVVLLIAKHRIIYEAQNPLTYILAFLLYGLAQIAFTTFLSCFFWRPIPAMLVGMAFCIPCACCSAAFAFWLNVRPISPLLSLFPPLTFCRAWFIIGYAASGMYLKSYFNAIHEEYLSLTLTIHPPNLVALDSYSTLVELYVSMVLCAILYVVLTLYLDKALPREHGLNRSPLFPLIYIRNKLKKYKSSDKVPLLAPVDGEEEDIVSFAAGDEDEDCQNERRKVKSNTDMLVKIVELSKKYDNTDKYALSSCCLGIEEGECLGLLGPNGAGKTTLISVLCGLTKPSGGYAQVLNNDIRTDMNRVHELLGLCPQHSILWPELTVEEHLLFYCALKNHGGDVAYLHVQKLAQEVGLSGESLHKRVSELSGGYKRRLSIGIALVGSSRLVLLDEPTAGLDHTSRRAIWDIIQRQKKAGRSFIITTHDMAEADVLCSRIAIISQGRLQRIGKPSHLKNKFGTGYNLKLTINKDFPTEQAQRDIAEIIPTAVLQSSAFDSLEFSIPSANVNLSEVYTNLTHKTGIISWSINPTSLEQVFLKLVHDDEMKGT